MKETFTLTTSMKMGSNWIKDLLHLYKRDRVEVFRKFDEYITYEEAKEKSLVNRVDRRRNRTKMTYKATVEGLPTEGLFYRTKEGIFFYYDEGREVTTVIHFDDNWMTVSVTNGSEEDRAKWKEYLRRLKKYTNEEGFMVSYFYKLKDRLDFGNKKPLPKKG